MFYVTSEMALRARKKEAIRTAKELYYPKEICQLIKAATTQREVDLALRSGRWQMKD